MLVPLRARVSVVSSLLHLRRPVLADATRKATRRAAAPAAMARRIPESWRPRAPAIETYRNGIVRMASFSGPLCAGARRDQRSGCNHPDCNVCSMDDATFARKFVDERTGGFSSDPSTAGSAADSVNVAAPSTPCIESEIDEERPSDAAAGPARKVAQTMQKKPAGKKPLEDKAKPAIYKKPAGKKPLDEKAIPAIYKQPACKQTLEEKVMPTIRKKPSGKKALDEKKPLRRQSARAFG